MLLQEIVKVAQQPTDQIDYKYFPELQQFRKAKVENYPLFYAKQGDRYLFSIKDGDKVIASIMAMEITDFPGGKEVVQIKRTWTDPQYRNTGLMTAMYRTLRKQRIAVISDAELSPQSIGVWKKLVDARYVSKMYNTQTQQLEPLTDEIWDEAEDKPAHLYFVLEGRGIHPFGFDDTDNFFLPEYCMFIGQDCP